jgi:hypothetical protein
MGAPLELESVLIASLFSKAFGDLTGGRRKLLRRKGPADSPSGEGRGSGNKVL